MNKILLHAGFLLLFVGFALGAVSEIREQRPRRRSVTFVGKASDLGVGEMLTADLEVGPYILGLLEYESIEPDSVLTIVREDDVEVYRAPMVVSWNPFTARYGYEFVIEHSGRYFVDLGGVDGFTIDISSYNYNGYRVYSYPYRYLLLIGAVFVIAALTIILRSINLHIRCVALITIDRLSGLSISPLFFM